MNVLSRLKFLLPLPQVFVVKVISVNDDGTSTVQFPSGAETSEVGGGLTVGATRRVRGTTVAAGNNAFVRADVIEGQAPNGEVAEVVVGTIAALPFGPARLTLGTALAPAAGTVGVAYTAQLAAGWVGGYVPRSYALTTGALPAGLTLDAVTGAISGTPAAAGVASGLVVTCTDATRAALASAAFSLTVA